MKIFIDTANVDEIREANDWGIIDGVTTNPSLVAREGRDYREVVEEIVQIVDGPISAECLTLTADEMVPEAKELAAIHPNIVVKIPMTTEGLKAVKILSNIGVKTNVTLVFSVAQAMLAAKAGATYVSPFVGRLDDISSRGMELIEKLVIAFANYGYMTEIIAASIRNPLHVENTMLAGAHIATIPMNILRLLPNHPLTTKGIDKFMSDYEKATKK